MINNNSPEMGYKRVIGASRGFRLNIRRFSIQKLRVRFINFFKVLFKWRKSYDRAINSFKKGISGGRRRNCNNGFATNYNHNHNQSKSRLISEQRKPDCRLRSLGRTNSFYTEAIADCLEFIKRNSLSVDDIRVHDDDEVAPIAATTLR